MVPKSRWNKSHSNMSRQTLTNQLDDRPYLNRGWFPPMAKHRIRIPASDWLIARRLVLPDRLQWHQYWCQSPDWLASPSCVGASAGARRRKWPTLPRPPGWRACRGRRAAGTGPTPPWSPSPRGSGSGCPSGGHAHKQREKNAVKSGKWCQSVFFPDWCSRFWFTATSISSLQCINFHLKACVGEKNVDAEVMQVPCHLTSTSSPTLSFHPLPLSDWPFSLESSNFGLIICIQTQSTPVTSPCPVLSPHCAPL